MQAEWIKVNQAGSNQFMILFRHDSVGFALARRTVTRKCYGSRAVATKCCGSKTH